MGGDIARETKCCLAVVLGWIKYAGSRLSGKAPSRVHGSRCGIWTGWRSTVRMIKPEKNNAALYALHKILVNARFLVLKREALDDVAVLLDYAEAMPRNLRDVAEKGSVIRVASHYPDVRGAGSLQRRFWKSMGKCCLFITKDFCS